MVAAVLYTHAQPTTTNWTKCVGQLDVRWLQIPIFLALIEDHGQHLGHHVVHHVVHTLNAAVALWVVGAGGELVNSKQLVDSVRKLEAELAIVVREYAARADPKGGYPC